MWLAAALGLLTPQQETAWTARLLTGNTQQRRDAAILIHLLRRPEHSTALTALLADPDGGVRAAAARALARRVLHDPADETAVQGVLLAAAQPCFTVPHSIAWTFTEQRPDSPPGQQLTSALASLSSHASGMVRQLARRATQLWAEDGPDSAHAPS